MKTYFVKTDIGQFELIGYQHFDKNVTRRDKPVDGFVLVKVTQGQNAAFPKKDVLNWDELPSTLTTPKTK